MSKLIDLTGKKFNRLTVIKRDFDKEKTIKGKDAYWLCVCDCGTIKSINTKKLRNGNTQSCGCLNRELIKKRFKKYNTYNILNNHNVGYTLKNEEFYFDIEDYDKIKNHCWRTDGNNYIVTRIDGVTILLHRLIMNCNQGEVVDHINHDVKDNRKCNLRICYVSDNLCNSGLRKNNTSGYTGIHEEGNGWSAELQRNNIKYRKHFTNLEDAIKYRKFLEDEIQREYKYDKERDVTKK